MGSDLSHPPAVEIVVLADRAVGAGDVVLLGEHSRSEAGSGSI
jgi:hypothetical protein